jgi:hypothetical protein
MLALLAVVLFAACGGNRVVAPPATSAGRGRAASTPNSPHYKRLVVHVLRATADGKSGEIGKLERPLADFRDMPVSLLIRKVQKAGERAPDALARFETRFEVGKSKVELPAFDLDCSKPDKCIKREWLDLELRAPGAPSRHIERVLFENEGDSEPPSFSRYTIVALSSAITRERVKELVHRHLGGSTAEQRKARAEALEAEARRTELSKQPALLARADDMDVSGALGNAIALEHAAESDEMTDTLARTLDVTVRREVPRVLITTIQARDAGDNPTLSLDLGLDEVVASSQKAGAAKLFQRARGLMESELEGTIMKTFGGEDQAVSTALLMKEADRNGIGVVPVTPGNRKALESLDLPAPFAALVKATLDRGHVVVLPKSAVALAGESRWGFWDIDPKTGGTVGVMQGGEHQGMVEVPAINENVAQNPKLGYCLGFMVGVISYEWGLSGQLLQYGGITPELIKQLKDELKNIACTNFCNIGAAAKLSVDITNCSKDLINEGKSPIPGEVGYCSEYKNGFECATGVLLASLSSPGKGPKLHSSAQEKVEVMCASAGL